MQISWNVIRATQQIVNHFRFFFSVQVLLFRREQEGRNDKPKGKSNKQIINQSINRSCECVWWCLSKGGEWTYEREVNSVLFLLKDKEKLVVRRWFRGCFLAIEIEAVEDHWLISSFRSVLLQSCVRAVTSDGSTVFPDFKGVWRSEFGNERDDVAFEFPFYFQVEVRHVCEDVIDFSFLVQQSFFL